jgi:hypothetical protein
MNNKTDVRQRARELLAAEYEAEGLLKAADSIRKRPIIQKNRSAAIRAIEAALSATAGGEPVAWREGDHYRFSASLFNDGFGFCDWPRKVVTEDVIAYPAQQPDSEPLRDWSQRMASKEAGVEIRAGSFGIEDVPQPVAGDAVRDSGDLDVLPPWPDKPPAWTETTVTYAEDGERVKAEVWRENDLFAYGRSCADAAIKALREQPASQRVPEGWRVDVDLAAQMLTWGWEDDGGLTERQEAEVKAHQAKIFTMLSATPSPAADYPECSGEPSSCPENEGYGCCKPNPPAAAAPVVDDAMVERAMDADAEEYGASIPESRVRLILTAALTKGDSNLSAMDDSRRLLEILNRIPTRVLNDWLDADMEYFDRDPTLDDFRAAIDAAMESSHD